MLVSARHLSVALSRPVPNDEGERAIAHLHQLIRQSNANRVSRSGDSIEFERAGQLVMIKHDFFRRIARGEIIATSLDA